MKYRGQWAVIPIAIASIATAVTTALPALANPLETPFQGTQTYSVTSSNQPDQCNSANAQAEVMQVRVTEALTALHFQVSGNSGQPTLRIRNMSTNRETCVTADNLSGSQVDVSAAWEGGLYSVSVGDRNGEAHGYTLSVRQN